MQKLRLQTESKVPGEKPKVTADQILPSGDTMNAVAIGVSLAVAVPVLSLLVNAIITAQQAQ